jgi:hypothetical protein
MRPACMVVHMGKSVESQAGAWTAEYEGGTCALGQNEEAPELEGNDQVCEGHERSICFILKIAWKRKGLHH